MAAVQRLLSSVNNFVASAALTASSVLPATNQVYRQPTTRAGNGAVSLSGGYTGSADATIEIEIRPNATGAERLSTPTLTGAGNGMIESLTVTPGTAAQTVTVTLVDAGSTTAAATVALYGALTLRAKTTGTSGNAIRVTVTPALTLGTALGATAVALTRNLQDSDDPRLDFGAVALNADGTLPATALRLVFNGDISRVYRHYKTWRDGRWQYGFSPALAADIPASSPVNPVTGTYSITVSDGVTPETYPTLTTLYDALRALAASALVSVDGVIANDTNPNGQAAIDLPIRTSAWVAGVVADAGLPELTVTAAPLAVTDRITVTCATADRWAVDSAAKGSLGIAHPGIPFDNAARFTLPLPPAQAASSAGSPVRLTQTRFAGRTPPDSPLPVLVVKKGTLGAKARSQSLTLTYTARPDIGCDSAGYQPAGVLSPTLLGLPNEAFTNLDTNFQTRLQALYDYRKAFVARNSRIRPAPATVMPIFTATATKSGNPTRTTTFSTAADLDSWQDYHVGDGWAVVAAPLTEAVFFDSAIGWTASTVYEADTVISRILPGADAKMVYFKTTAGGTSGASEPAWGDKSAYFYTQRDRVIVDGTATWRFSSSQSAGALWTASTAYAIPNKIYPIPMGPKYDLEVAGTSAANNDAFSLWTKKPTVTDGSVSWASLIPTSVAVWTVSKTVAINARFNAGTGKGWYVATTTGTTNPSAAPAWGSADVLTDGTIVWTRAVTYQAIGARISSQDLAFVDGVLSILGQNLSQIYSSSPARALWDAAWTAAQTDLQTLYDVGGTVEQAVYDSGFLERYRTQCDSILVSIGVSPGKFEAGSKGSAVWPDTGDAFWWVFADADYLPVFTNQIYHACRRNSDGEPASTQEFAFALVCACPERLVAGDSVQIQIQPGVVSEGGYPVGAKYLIDLIGAAPLALAGGRAGTDTLTWAVSSSTAGALADYALTVSEPAYSAGGLGFRIRRGALPFALGDQFRWAVETGGRFRWRKDAAAWSADTALPTTPLSLIDGLSATFAPGPAPGFVSGDIHRFVVRQPAAVTHLQRGDGLVWQWSGASATVTADFGTDKSISAVGVLRHGLSAPATVSIALQNAAGTTLQTVPLTVGAGPLIGFLATPVTARKIVVTLASATGMNLGWLYAGLPFVPSHNATTCSVRRVYALERGGGINPSGAYLGAGRGGAIAWKDWLEQSDLDTLLALMDDSKAHGDEPLVVVPNVIRPDEAALVRIAGDDVEITDVFEFQPNNPSRRRLSLTAAFTAVVA